MKDSFDFLAQKSASGSQKVTLKGGLAVDPECEVADVAHVYKVS